MIDVTLNPVADFGFVKPAKSMIKKATGDQKMAQVWEVRRSGTTMTVREGPEGELGSPVDHPHASQEEVCCMRHDSR